MSSTLPSSVGTSNAIVTRLRKKRDLETTMNTLKQLLEPSLPVTSKKGSRKKNKPRSLAVKAVSNKTISRSENCSEDDGEYYPNKLKRTMQLKKTVLRPRHKLKVVVTTNKRKRCTPHKGIEPHFEKSQPPTKQDYNPPPDLNIHTVPDNVNIHSEHNVNVHTSPAKLNVHTESSNEHVHTIPGNINVQTLPANLNTASDLQHTVELKVHTPPPSNPGTIKYDLISPPHKSLTQMTVDDLIRMDEDSLSDDDLMEILTCPSPVWWEEPDECKDVLYLTKTAEDSTTKISKGNKHIIEINKESIQRTGIVTVNKSKAKKIAKLENILGHIKSLVRSDDKLFVDSSEMLKDNNDIANDDSNNSHDNLHRATVQNIDATAHILVTKDSHDNDNIKGSETRTVEPDITKRRKISSSGSEISVNEDDLLRNLECINIPIKNQDTDWLEKDVNVNDFKSTNSKIDNKVMNRSKCDEVKHKSPENKSSKVKKDSLNQNKSDDTVHVPDKQKEPEQGNKSKESDRIIDSNKETSKPKSKENASEAKHKSILNKLKQNDDILDVRLIKTPTNVTNEVKIWSKLDNFKRHNFKPQDFVNEVVDVEDELAFSVIESKNSHKEERDQLELKNETILIDDDSNDALDQNTKPTTNMIDYDVIEHFNDVTITAITESYANSQSGEVIETDVTKDIARLVPVNDRDIIKEGTVSTSSVLGVGVPETSDILAKPKLKRKKVGLKVARKQYANILKKKKNTESRGIRISPMETIVENQQSLTICPSAYTDQKSNEDLITIDSADTTGILSLSDGDVTHMIPSPKNDKTSDINVTDGNPAENNDLTVPSVNNSDSIDAAAPLLLATLTKTPTKPFESPISVKSTNSENTLDYFEGTISDTNIHFLDEYEEKVEKKSEGASEEHDIEDNIIIDKHLNEEKMSIDIDSDQNVEKDSSQVDKVDTEGLGKGDNKGEAEEISNEITLKDFNVIEINEHTNTEENEADNKIQADASEEQSPDENVGLDVDNYIKDNLEQKETGINEKDT